MSDRGISGNGQREMSDVGKNDFGKERQRALFSCDRCKKRKRACKRYDPVTGVQCFDNTTPCENCANVGDSCQTTITRKKRTFYSVSESSIVQLRCLTKIVKAMFPESDPNNFEDIENIAKLLYVKLPDKEKAIRQGTIQNPFAEIYDHEGQSERKVDVENHENTTDKSDSGSGLTSEENIGDKKRRRTSLNDDDDDDDDNDNDNNDVSSIVKEENVDEHETKRQSITGTETNNLETDKVRLSNLKRIAEEIDALRTSNNTNFVSATTDTHRRPSYTLSENHIGLGGTERLFTALLEVEKRRTHSEGPVIDHNNLLTHVIQQHVKNTFRPSFIINNNDIEKYLVLDSIPQQECLLYTNYFFKNIHEGYFMFNEKKFRDRLNEFFEILSDKSEFQEKLRKYKFSNEEICTIYIVWILGRKGHLLSLVLNNKSLRNLNLVSDYVITDYLNAIHLCLCNVFFSNNISTVRLLYFTSLFHATIKNRNSIWHLVANTCIKCICLGYTKQYALRNFSEEEQEAIKITWWSSFKLHMTNCTVLGRLPSVSLNEVDIGFPKLDFSHDELFKKTYIASLHLFKIMFLILKNREYLIKSKDPWCKQNYINIMYINNQLIEWDENLEYTVKHYQRPKPKRAQIKLHMQYHYCVSSLIVPYLIAYALKPKESVKSSPEIVKTLCYAINSAIKMVNVIVYSSIYLNFNGLLSYDLFYAYNSLMILLLGYTLIRHGSINEDADDFNVFADVLKKEFKIDLCSILHSINNIKGINNRFGSSATSIMKDASTNINLLLKYFKMDGDLSVEESLEKFAQEEKRKTEKQRKKEKEKEKLEEKEKGKKYRKETKKDVELARTESITSNLSDDLSMANISNAFDNIETIPYKYGNVPLLPSSIPDRAHLNTSAQVNSSVNNTQYLDEVAPEQITLSVNLDSPNQGHQENLLNTLGRSLPTSGQQIHGDLGPYAQEYSINEGITSNSGISVGIGAGVGGQDYDNIATLDKDFLEIISFMNKETQPGLSAGEGEKLFWDWNNLFSAEESFRNSNTHNKG